jgi:hypothetical protein
MTVIGLRSGKIRARPCRAVALLSVSARTDSITMRIRRSRKAASNSSGVGQTGSAAGAQTHLQKGENLDAAQGYASRTTGRRIDPRSLRAVADAAARIAACGCELTAPTCRQAEFARSSLAYRASGDSQWAGIRRSQREQGSSGTGETIKTPNTSAARKISILNDSIHRRYHTTGVG